MSKSYRHDPYESRSSVKPKAQKDAQRRESMRIERQRRTGEYPVNDHDLAWKPMG